MLLIKEKYFNTRDLKTGSAIFLDCSRLNHSCEPNSNNNWKENLQKMTIYALNDIEKGDEITISYNQTPNTIYKQRQRKLLNVLKFHCNCKLCKYSVSLRLCDDDIRKKCKYLHKKLIDITWCFSSHRFTFC